MAKTLTGKVVSTKMQKTIVVEVEKSFRHRLYNKTLTRHKRFKAHADGTIPVIEGDMVDIQETKPISKDKQFKVIKKH